MKKIKNIFKQTIFVGPFMDPNIKIDRHIFNKLDRISLESNVNSSIINVDNELEIASRINNIQYISSIKILSYDPVNDFISMVILCIGIQIIGVFMAKNILGKNYFQIKN